MNDERFRSLRALNASLDACRRCPLWKNATQAVGGEGPRRARIVLVGEQPGDQEDRRGAPFIGPAGQLLDRAIEAAGLDRSSLYVTNTVKHFKWVPMGKRRMHKTPAQREIAACLDWLQQELRLIRPDVIVCLGGTAAHVLVGKTVRVTTDRGKRYSSPFARVVLVTLHPSALLRLRGTEERKEAFDLFVADLARAQRIATQAD